VHCIPDHKRALATGIYCSSRSVELDGMPRCDADFPVAGFTGPQRC